MFAQTDVTPASSPGYTSQFTTVNGKLVWRYNGGGTDQGFVTYDPADGGLQYFDNVTDIVNLTSYGDFAISRGNDANGGGNGMQWTDGESFETLTVYNNQGEANFYHNGVVYQIAKRDEIGTVRNGNSARKIWSYDFEIKTGGQLTDVNPEGGDLGNGGFRRVAPFGDLTLLGVVESGSNHFLYTSDGSSITKLSSDLITNDEPFMALSESLVLIFGQSATDALGVELYSYDGSTVAIVEDFQAGTAGGGYNSQIGANQQLGFVLNGYGYFTGASSTGTGVNVYKSNGNSIELVVDFSASGVNGASSLNLLTAVSDTEFAFKANDADGTSGEELWGSDGTPGSTMMLLDINVGSGGSSITNMNPIDGGAVFSATNGTEEGIYYTDGTVSGTSLISDLSLHNGVKALRAIGSKAFFIDDDNKLFELDIPVTGTSTYTTSWDNGTPSSTNAIVDGDLVVGSTSVLNIQNLEVESGASIIVELGSTLVVGGDIFNQGTITVESGGSLITYDGEYLIGNDVTAIRRTTFNEATGQYSVVGSPMTVATTTVLGANAKVYSYNETLAYGTARFEEVVAGSVMTPGVGYFSAFTGDANGDITFTGTPNTGDIDVALSYSSGDANDGYNLVSNPYLAAISLNQLATDNASSIDGNFYIWDDNNPQGTQGTDADYITANSSGVVSNNSEGAKGSGFDGNIRSGQGFFVKASSESTLTFSSSQVVNGSNGSDYFFRADGGVDFTRFKISINGEGGYNETLLAFRDNASSAFDRSMDGLKLAGSGVQLFSYIEEERYAIQTLNSSDLQGAQIDLGVFVSEAGSYTFNVAEIENLPSGLEIVLTNVDTNEEYVLTDGQIDLSLNASVDAQSFTVSLRSLAVLALENPNSNNLVVYNSGNSLNLNFADDTSLIDFDIFNISGQKVFSARNEQVYANTWKGNIALSQGNIYIIKIRSEGSVLSQKFIY